MGTHPVADREANPSYAALLAMGDLCARPVRSRQELEEAGRLVYHSYRARGYIDPHPHRVRLTIFNAFPTTVTFVSVLRGSPVASVTVVEDTPVGLPMDEIYHEELEDLRRQGRKLAEATMFADRRREKFRRTLPMLLLLMKRAFDYCSLVIDADDFCITVNPRHESFYQRQLLFKPLGPHRSYPSVRGNPAVAKRLDLNSIREECRGNRRLWQQFFESRTPLPLLKEGYRLSCSDLRYLFLELTDIFQNASPEEIDAVSSFYPQCPWDRWRDGL